MTSLHTNPDLMASTIAQMNRDQVKNEILHFEGRFKLDFAEDYLDKLPLEKLRHILLAARLQQCQMN